MNLGEKIRALRKNKPTKYGDIGMSQEALGKELEVTRQIIIDWEMGRYRPTPERIADLSKFFGKPIQYFQDDEAEPAPQRQPTDSEYVDLPIMGVLPAGSPDDATANYKGMWDVRRRVLHGPVKEHIVVEARGDSMIQFGIFDGDKLTVHLQPDADDGKIIAAYVENDGVTCKRLRKKDGRAYLEAGNPARKAPTGPFRIIGVVVWREGKSW